jgi:iron complex transport system permease protein
MFCHMTTKSVNIILGFLSLLTLISAPLIGSSEINLYSDLGIEILFTLRIPRVLFAFLVGFALALIGTVYQSLLRNDLATPYTLGVSTGGALGAVLAIKLGIDFSWAGYSTSTFFSIAGSYVTIWFIYLVAHTPSGSSTVRLVLTGVTISLFFSSLILFIHYLADFTETYRMIRWLMGGLQIAGWQYIWVLLPLVVVFFIYFLLHGHAFNIMSAGYEAAMSKGVDVDRLQRRSFVYSSLLIGVVVAFAGPIGFIGLIIPHLMRLLIGSDHRPLLPAAALTGGVFLVWCDTLARTIIAPAELPVGVITALIGAPFFIWLLIRSQRIV